MLSDRGFVKQCTDEESLSKLMGEKNLTVYCGYDPTADSLHVGHLFTVKALKHLEDAGHRIIILLGGGTAMVGDPTGKSEMRQMLTRERINGYCERFKEQVGRFLDVEGGKTLVVNNADWLLELNYLDFLRDIGRHFSVNRMLSFDSVKLRLEREQPLSFLEFNYMVFQAYDFLELARRHECVLQLGGSDQWGNILNGIDLTRRVLNKSLFGLTSPLLETASGEKMGKTADGAVWLNEERLSTYDYWQYWRNIEDADVGKFLRLFTEIPEREIGRLERLQGAEINHAKVVLADAATALCRGKAAAEAAATTARETFELGKLGGDLPTFELSRDHLSAGITLIEIFQIAGLAKSNGEVRRLIRGGGARINDISVSSEEGRVTLKDLDDQGLIKLSSGRKRHAILRLI